MFWKYYLHLYILKKIDCKLISYNRTWPSFLYQRWMKLESYHPWPSNFISPICFSLQTVYTIHFIVKNNKHYAHPSINVAHITRSNSRWKAENYSDKYVRPTWPLKIVSKLPKAWLRVTCYWRSFLSKAGIILWLLHQNNFL